MYPQLNRLSIHERDESAMNFHENDYQNEIYYNNVTLPHLRQTISQNINFFDVQQRRIIEKYLQDEQDYLDRLAVLEVQKFDLRSMGIPDYDLQNLFGQIENIKMFHEQFLPNNFVHCIRIEDILSVFIRHRHKLRVYVLDQWQKSQVKFSGKDALLKRFYHKGVIKDLSLPEQRISDYLNFHEYIKANYHYLKSSEIVQQSLQVFNNIYIQMQYAKQFAVIEKFPMYIDQDVLLDNSFHVTIDNGLPFNYKIFCMDRVIVFTSQGSNNNMGKAEFFIKNDTISLNASCRDEVSFEMYEHLEKGQKKTYLFVSESTYIRTKWVDMLKKILYKQMVTEKRRVKSNSDESHTH